SLNNAHKIPCLGRYMALKQGINLKIQLTDNGIQFGDFVKLCAIGMTCSIGMLFIVVAILMIPIALISGELQGLLSSIIMIVMAPIVCAFNGAFFGAIIFLGLRVYKKFKPLEFV
uniref:hypothetical protein n=1 Tax=Paraglaciecola marina TaxID=2500157 RepID=UPI0019809A74